MCDLSWPNPKRVLHYDKGEHRRQHRSAHHRAAMVLQKGDFWVAKCPRLFSETRALMLLQNAIPEFRTPLGTTPYRMWTYFEGVIYAACSHDGGDTWYGFPNGPPMPPPPRTILRELRRRASAIGEEPRLDAWLCKQWKVKR